MLFVRLMPVIQETVLGCGGIETNLEDNNIEAAFRQCVRYDLASDTWTVNNEFRLSNYQRTNPKSIMWRERYGPSQPG